MKQRIAPLRSAAHDIDCIMQPIHNNADNWAYLSNRIQVIFIRVATMVLCGISLNGSIIEPVCR